METERLIFRRYGENDETEFIKLFTDAEVMKYVGVGVLNPAQAEAFWRKLHDLLCPQNYNIWAIFTKENSYVGHTGIYPRPTREEDWEFVYFLSRNNWGKGYATEIAGRIIEYAFEELHLPTVYATVDDEHFNSIRVFEKAGMNFLRHEFDAQGKFSVYSIRAKIRP